uniref:Cyclic nucleotide-binding domain-containing protein n=1 Tax=Denticeps clupeoides TaxID=299321 RepID=A0AAY4B3S7_9TELE
MEAELEKLRKKLKKQCQLNKDLQNHNQELERRLQEKEKLVQELQSHFDELATPESNSQRSSNESVPEVQQIRAAVMAPEPIPDILEVTRVKKTAGETEQIKRSIQRNDFLRRLDEEQITMMVELLVTLDRAPGDEIIVEGSEGDSMYIVSAGELKVSQAGRDLRTLTSGDVFGELAILYNCKRTASVRGEAQHDFFRKTCYSMCFMGSEVHMVSVHKMTDVMAKSTYALRHFLHRKRNPLTFCTQNQVITIFR